MGDEDELENFMNVWEDYDHGEWHEWLINKRKIRLLFI